ncbi:Gp138 family membrane-puncturing spike protein [Desertibacillus haloalkaliphilus]|uniref:Gp138 family membrane-puncturing spike protein n=1 Tax=Desertibacillus haloalkaliphilus TaxID=1328930 RepID=UPI001C267247|nr:Gp138 family membrane-puncturing spike protein [Desertibacillus haloalkaliphilus]MBU8908497.1 hypothetical protein [Desertibacillus haloalkaliphilus]
MDQVKTIRICRIEKFDAATMTADITILQTEAGLNNEVFNVPVSHMSFGDFVIRPSYKRGDLVIVGFSDTAIDDVLISANQQESDITERFREEDAIVLQGINSMKQTLPSDHSNDLVIAKKDFSSKIVIKDNNDIVLEASGSILLGESASEGVPLGNQLKQWLDAHQHDITALKNAFDNHTHEYSWTNSGGNGTTSSPSTSFPSSTSDPTSGSPDSSEKVKI